MVSSQIYAPRWGGVSHPQTYGKLPITSTNQELNLADSCRSKQNDTRTSQEKWHKTDTKPELIAVNLFAHPFARTDQFNSMDVALKEYLKLPAEEQRAYRTTIVIDGDDYLEFNFSGAENVVS